MDSLVVCEMTLGCFCRNSLPKKLVENTGHSNLAGCWGCQDDHSHRAPRPCSTSLWLKNDLCQLSDGSCRCLHRQVNHTWQGDLQRPSVTGSIPPVWWFLWLATESSPQETLTTFLLEPSSWRGEVVLTLAPQQPGPASSVLKRVGTGPQCIPMKTLQSHVFVWVHFLTQWALLLKGAVGQQSQPEKRAGLVAVNVASASLGITSAYGGGGLHRKWPSW